MFLFVYYSSFIFLIRNVIKINLRYDYFVFLQRLFLIFFYYKCYSHLVNEIVWFYLLIIVFIYFFLVKKKYKNNISLLSSYGFTSSELSSDQGLIFSDTVQGATTKSKAIDTVQWIWRRGLV